MKYKSTFLALSIFISIVSCTPEHSITAETIIQNAIEKAHGGKALWEQPRDLMYEKTTILYDSLGTEESQIKQVFRNTLQPEFISKVIWKENGVEKRIVFDGQQTFLFHNGVVQTNPAAIDKATKDILGAQFVLWQPYKLLTDDVKLTLEDTVTLDDGSKAFKIKAVYPNSENEWWFYFDTQTYLLKENLVKHGKTYSQIKNIFYEEQTGLRLHKKRKSYLIDSTKNQKYHRATYHYNIIKLN